MRKFLQFLSLLLHDERGEVDLPTGSPAAVADPAPVASVDPAPAADPAAPVSIDVPTPDPNDPLAALQAAMDAGLGVDDPAPDPNAVVDPNAAAIPEQFQQALQISEFVKSPETVQQAVRAADEVWKVATGAIPARTMLEGFKNSNPQQYEAIVADLKDYLGASANPAAANPLAELQTANPAAFKQIADFYKAQTGKDLGGSQDPNQARLDALEARYAKDEQDRQTAQFQQQQQVAHTKGVEFITSKLKGTFAEGQEAFMLPLIAQKLGDPNAAMQEILSGKTGSLEKALAAVKKELAPVIKAFNANLVKQHNALKNTTPATKNAPAGAPKGVPAEMAAKPGETAAEQIDRLVKAGKL